MLTAHSHSLSKGCGNIFANTFAGDVVIHCNMLTAHSHSLSKGCGNKFANTSAGDVVIYTAICSLLTLTPYQKVQVCQYLCWQCSYILPLLTDHSHSLSKGCGNKFANTSAGDVVIHTLQCAYC
jgi:hypothetical protein